MSVMPKCHCHVREPHAAWLLRLEQLEQRVAALEAASKPAPQPEAWRDVDEAEE